MKHRVFPPRSGERSVSRVLTLARRDRGRAMQSACLRRLPEKSVAARITAWCEAETFRFARSTESRGTPNMATQTAVPTRAPEELRAQFRRAIRVPQLWRSRSSCRVALRQVSDAMDEADGGDSDAELTALFAQLKGCSTKSPAGSPGRRRSTISIGARRQPAWCQRRRAMGSSTVRFCIARAIAAQSASGRCGARARNIAELARRVAAASRASRCPSRRCRSAPAISLRNSFAVSSAAI